MVQLMPLAPHLFWLHPEWFNLSGDGLPWLSWKTRLLVKRCQSLYFAFCWILSFCACVVTLFLPRDAMLSRYMRSRLSVCLSVTNRCFAETAKRRITRTMSHDSPGTLVFCCRRPRQNSNGVTPNEAPNAGGVC